MNQKFVFDTHTFIWCLSEAKHKFLSQKAFQVFNEIRNGNAKGFISVIALAELAHLFSRGRINLSLEQALSFIKNNPSFIISVVELDHILLMETFSDIPEMHDRFIASLTKSLDAILITRDRALQNSRHVSILWD